jgi:S-adenosylmethionine-diacylgycerolhomoserine-N-methlytransferase
MSMSAQPPIDGGADSGQQRDMDRMYRFQRHIYDSTRRFYLLGRERLISELGVPVNGSALEIGCGTGRNLVKVAKAYAACGSPG